MINNVINIIMFIICLIIWLYRMLNNKFNYLTHIIAGVGGFFLGQTIAWLFGNLTLIDKIFN